MPHDAPEVLVVFDEPIAIDDGPRYLARVLAARTGPDHWEGWIEFTAESDGATVRTERETTQPNLADLEYWAGGLSRIYLEGALRRAMDRESTTD